MARRSPARLLAPLALVGFVVALLVVLNGVSVDGTSSSSGSKPAASATATPTRKQKARQKRKRYTVKAGDTPSGIAQKTGVPVSQILALNPSLDEQSLPVGRRIKIRR